MVNNLVKCPKCSSEFPINESIKEELRKEYNLKFIAIKNELEKEKLNLKQKEAKFDENLQNALNLELQKEKINLKNVNKQYNKLGRICHEILRIRSNI